MPTKYLYTDEDISNDGWSVVGGAFVWEVLDDPHDSYDDFTTCIQMSSSAPKTAKCGIQSLTDPVGAIVSCTNWFRGRTNSGSAWASGQLFIDANGPYMVAQNDATGSFQTKSNGPAATNPYTSNPWTVADINNTVRLHGRAPADLGVQRTITALHLQVDYVPPDGGFSLYIAQWLPPLIAVASHCLSKSEIFHVLSRLNPCPSNDEDFARIIEAFRRRPVYGYSR